MDDAQHNLLIALIDRRLDELSRQLDDTDHEQANAISDEIANLKVIREDRIDAFNQYRYR